MLNPKLVKFIIQNNLEESKVEEKSSVKEIKMKKNIVDYGKFAVIPVDVKK